MAHINISAPSCNQDWSQLPQLALGHIVNFVDDPSDLASLRLACRRWAKTVTQHAAEWRVRGPVARFHWDYLRGTLYTLCPVIRRLVLVLSNRVTADSLEAICADLTWWSRLCEVELCSMRPASGAGLFGPGLQPSAMGSLAKLRGLTALTLEGCECTAALQAAISCPQLTRLVVRSRAPPLGAQCRVTNVFLEMLTDTQRRIAAGEAAPRGPQDGQDSLGEDGPAGAASGSGQNQGGSNGLRLYSDDMADSEVDDYMADADLQSGAAPIHAASGGCCGGGLAGAANGARAGSGGLEGPEPGGLRHLEFDSDGHLTDAASTMSFLDSTSFSAGLSTTRLAALLSALPRLEHLDMSRVPLDEGAVRGPLAEATRLTELHAAIMDGRVQRDRPAGEDKRILRVLAALADPTWTGPLWRPPLPTLMLTSAAPHQGAGTHAVPLPYGPPPGPGRPALHLHISGVTGLTAPGEVLEALVPLVPRLRALTFSHRAFAPPHLLSVGQLTSLTRLTLSISRNRGHTGAEREAAAAAAAAAAAGAEAVVPEPAVAGVAAAVAAAAAGVRGPLARRRAIVYALSRGAWAPGERLGMLPPLPGLDGMPGFGAAGEQDAGAYDDDDDHEMYDAPAAVGAAGGRGSAFGGGGGCAPGDAAEPDSDGGEGLGLAALRHLTSLAELHLRGTMEPVRVEGRVAAGLAALARRGPHAEAAARAEGGEAGPRGLAVRRGQAQAALMARQEPPRAGRWLLSSLLARRGRDSRERDREREHEALRQQQQQQQQDRDRCREAGQRLGGRQEEQRQGERGQGAAGGSSGAGGRGDGAGLSGGGAASSCAVSHPAAGPEEAARRMAREVRKDLRRLRPSDSPPPPLRRPSPPPRPDRPPGAPPPEMDVLADALATAAADFELDPDGEELAALAELYSDLCDYDLDPCDWPMRHMMSHRLGLRAQWEEEWERARRGAASPGAERSDAAGGGAGADGAAAGGAAAGGAARGGGGEGASVAGAASGAGAAAGIAAGANADWTLAASVSAALAAASQSLAQRRSAAAGGSGSGAAGGGAAVAQAADPGTSSSGRYGPGGRGGGSSGSMPAAAAPPSARPRRAARGWAWPGSRLRSWLVGGRGAEDTSSESDEEERRREVEEERQRLWPQQRLVRRPRGEEAAGPGQAAARGGGGGTARGEPMDVDAGGAAVARLPRPPAEPPAARETSPPVVMVDPPQRQQQQQQQQTAQECAHPAEALRALARDRLLLRRAALALAPNDVAALATHGSVLQVLSLHYFRMPPDVIDQLAAALPRLRSLSLRWANDAGHAAAGAEGGGGRLELGVLPPRLASLELGGPVRLRVAGPDPAAPGGSAAAAAAPVWAQLRRLVITDGLSLPSGSLPALLGRTPALTELQLQRPRGLPPDDLEPLSWLTGLRTLVVDFDLGESAERRFAFARAIRHASGLTALRELRWDVPDTSSPSRRGGLPEDPMHPGMELCRSLSRLTALHRLCLLSLPGCRTLLGRLDELQALRHMPGLELAPS